MKSVLFALLFLATPAFAQVQVDARVEKPVYLEGEPIFVIVDVTNIDDEAVAYPTCGVRVALSVADVARRTPPDISGCFLGVGGTGMGWGCAGDQPAHEPGQLTSFRYLLREYDLKPGTHKIVVSGAAAAATVPGAQFERTLEVGVVQAAPQELERAFAGFVFDADGPNAGRRIEARAAIVESAPPFLEPLIARIAAEDQFNDTGIDALRRIASVDSRSHLKGLYQQTADTRRRSFVVEALARIGHRDDADFLASVLNDGAADNQTKRYAALGLGHIGGDQAAGHLQNAWPGADARDRLYIATGLGNTRSRLAVPALIMMFGDSADRDSLCGALTTLTHSPCNGDAIPDDRELRRWWEAWWKANESSAEIYGTDRCP